MNVETIICNTPLAFNCCVGSVLVSKCCTIEPSMHCIQLSQPLPTKAKDRMRPPPRFMVPRFMVTYMSIGAYSGNNVKD